MLCAVCCHASNVLLRFLPLVMAGSPDTRSTVSLLDQHEKNEHELHKQVAKSWRLNSEADTNKDDAIDDPEDSFSGFGSNPDGSHWTIKSRVLIFIMEINSIELCMILRRFWRILRPLFLNQSFLNCFII